MAPSGYFLKLHIHYAMALYAVVTFPTAWKVRYSQRAYQQHDPIFGWAFGHEGVVRWDEMLSHVDDPDGVLADAATFGLRHGVCCSVGPMTSRSIVAAARETDPFTDEELAEFAFLSRRMHKVTEPPRSLTPAQVEALRRIEAGDRHEVAAEALGISVSAFKARLSSARDKLMCGTTSETVERAREYGLM